MTPRKTVLALVLAALPFAARAAEPVSVMIVGGFHMSNPGRDLHNVHVDDVLAPRRQTEIQAVTDALARFKPTAVATEWDPGPAADRYTQYRAGTLAPSRNEVVQLGFRLAAAMNLPTVHGIDVDGEFPYEPVDAYAKAHGQSALLDGANGDVEAFVRHMDDLLEHGTIGGALRFLNDPAEIERGNTSFYGRVRFIGGGSEQPGAELLTAWYRRNALICANLVQLAKPGDRIVVFYGSGHSYLLRQCVREVPGFRLVEPNDYLPR
jgi:Family of unknown function (DUF5694)